MIGATFGGLLEQALGDGKVKHGFHLSTNPRFEPSCEQPTNANLDEVAGQCVKSFSESPSYLFLQGNQSGWQKRPVDIVLTASGLLHVLYLPTAQVSK